jgi:hypothetical protein
MWNLKLGDSLHKFVINYNSHNSFFIFLVLKKLSKNSNAPKNSFS